MKIRTYTQLLGFAAIAALVSHLAWPAQAHAQAFYGYNTVTTRLLGNNLVIQEQIPVAYYRPVQRQYVRYRNNSRGYNRQYRQPCRANTPNRGYNTRVVRPGLNIGYRNSYPIGFRSNGAVWRQPRAVIRAAF